MVTARSKNAKTNISVLLVVLVMLVKVVVLAVVVELVVVVLSGVELSVVFTWGFFKCLVRD